MDTSQTSMLSNNSYHSILVAALQHNRMKLRLNQDLFDILENLVAGRFQVSHVIHCLAKF